MIFADKIIQLRKKNGWSQEELAEKMNVSRQAVSKWEGAQAIPDLSKILALSELFGVSTDYLLKDEVEVEATASQDGEPAVRRVSLDEAQRYLFQRKSAARRIALATLLCILSPIPLILLAVATDVPAFAISENLAAGLGLIVLLLCVAVAVALYVYTGFQNGPYEFLKKEPFDLEYGVKGMVTEKQQAYRNTYAAHNTIGVCICVLSPVPLFIGAFTANDFFTVGMLAITLLLVGIGVVLFITAGVQWASMQMLLRQGEYSVEEKAKRNVTGPISTVYWLLAVCIYLGVSFTSKRWETSWIIWPLAGIGYAAVLALCRLYTSHRKSAD